MSNRQRRILDLFAGAVQILAGGVEGFEKIHAFTAARTARFLDGWFCYIILIVKA